MKLSEIPALKLFVIVAVISLLLDSINLNWELSIAGCILTTFVAIIFGLARKNPLAYYFGVIAICFILSLRIDYFESFQPDKIIPSHKAIFRGEVTELLKSEKSHLKFIAKGVLNSQELPMVEDVRVLITMFKPKVALLPGNHFTTSLDLVFATPNLPESEFSTSKYLKAADIDFASTASGSNILIEDRVNYFSKFAYDIRSNITRRIYRLFDTNSASHMTALLTGDKSLIDRKLKEHFVLSGTAHILAVSGLHVGLIAFIIFNLLSFIRNEIIKSIITVALLFMFIYMTGFLISGVRAALMISVYILSQNFERKTNPLNSIGIAGLVLLIFDPNVIFSVSFQMSFSSVIGIILFYPILSKRFIKLLGNNKFSVFISNSLAITFASSILISPLVAYYFGIYSLISPIANLIVVPIMVLAMSFGIAAVAVSYFSHTVAEFYSISSSYLINLSDMINSISISTNFSYLKGDFALFVSLVSSGIIVYLISNRNRNNFIFRTIISSFVILLSSQVLPETNHNVISVVPKENYTVIILEDEESHFLLLFDRKPANVPRKDFEISNYILNSSKYLNVGFTGNSGIATIDATKKKKKFNYFELDLKSQQKLINLLKLKEHPVKLINF